MGCRMPYSISARCEPSQFRRKIALLDKRIGFLLDRRKEMVEMLDEEIIRRREYRKTLLSKDGNIKKGKKAVRLKQEEMWVIIKEALNKNPYSLRYDICCSYGVHWGTLARNLKLMEEMGIVESTKEPRKRYYLKNQTNHDKKELNLNGVIGETKA